jgi:DNA transformation protein and related proteins
MAHADNEFVDFIMDEIGDPLLVAKKMFGGYGIYRDGIFFGIVLDGTLYLKTNARTKPWYLKEGMAPLRATTEQVLTRYYEVPEYVMDDRELLAEKARESWTIAGNEKF